MHGGKSRPLQTCEKGLQPHLEQIHWIKFDLILKDEVDSIVPYWKEKKNFKFDGHFDSSNKNNLQL